MSLRKSTVSKIIFALASGAVIGIAGLSGSYVVPLDNEVIQYATRPVDDPITRLKKRIASGDVKLTYEDGMGYLRSVLKALDIPVESQVMVFTKTSFQAPRINPRMPRALYFNDQVSVGFVRGGDVLEIASHDPKQGVIFYTIDQEPNRAKIERNDTCLQCHHSGGTLGVPGLFVSSVYPDSSGMPLFQNGTFVVNQNRAFAERWGGWYVTGTHGKQTHRGNAVVRDKSRPDQLETEGTQNRTDLTRFFDTGAYLSSHSDIAALMVLEHQTHMTNLITRVGFEARMAVHSSQVINKALGEPVDKLSESTVRRINNASEELLEYLLFAEEASITEPIRGTSGFAEVFAKAGPRNKNGRSLRDLDMTSRLFRYPCSYMIYSEAFDSMPTEARERILRRLWEVLHGDNKNPAFKRLTPKDRQAILEILTETKDNLPAWWTAKPQSITTG
ncbi:MAG TPA: hypothetical protein VEX68_08030 [Bryobacteraceae bacterium]|nr:hypothetical protein [Bryobacteraceae bacterium]